MHRLNLKPGATAGVTDDDFGDSSNVVHPSSPSHLLISYFSCLRPRLLQPSYPLHLSYRLIIRCSLSAISPENTRVGNSTDPLVATCTKGPENQRASHCA